ncbi:DUF2439 domain containing protein [Nitzschia inconspicua]|uniref:DUF2439 domain containing protein n=1 Tax=Nitzschia inconspicua TaxID=303405 RepID=A0A9K3KES3_9STRA|nr:DUF2439 domain containing protein [Nitzschia inconspicua]
MSKPQLSCLYTKHKTQKRKVWKDGRLVLTSNRAILHDANPVIGSADPSLDSCEVAPNQRQDLLQAPRGQTLEMEKFLVEVEGPWNAAAAAAVTTLPTTAHTLSKQVVSSSMQKVFKSKFQKPKPFVPSQPGSQPGRLQTILGKRRRPLQPGELVKMRYGCDAVDGDGGPMGNFAMKLGSSSPPQRHQFLQTNGEPNQRSQYQQQCNPISPSNGGALEQSITQHPSQGIGRDGNQSATVSLPTTDYDTSATRLLGNPNQQSQMTGNFRNQQNPLISTNDVRQPNKPLSFFANNEFNARSYYGLEEEVDEPEQEHRDISTNTLSSQGMDHAQLTVNSGTLATQILSNGTLSQFQSEKSRQTHQTTSQPPAIVNEMTTKPSSGREFLRESIECDEDSDSEDDACDGPSSFRLVNTDISTNASSSFSQPLSKSNTLTSNEMMALFGMAPPSPRATTAHTSEHDTSSKNFGSSGKENKIDQSVTGNESPSGMLEAGASIDEVQKLPTSQLKGFFLAPADTSSDESSEDES